MRTQPKQRIEVDDIAVGTRMTVLDCNVASPRRVSPSFDVLKGAVLDVVAVSLPYLMVRIHDPMRGTAAMAIDVRELRFAPVSAEYAEAIIAECEKSCEDECPF